MPNVTKLTPVLVVDAIEPCLDFWVRRLGFEKTAEVPHDGRLGFVLLQQGTVELMLQTRASVRADAPAMLKPAGCSPLFLEVGDLAAVKRAMEGIPLVIEERTTAYGSTEIGVLDPAGNPVLFAHFPGR